MNQEKKAIIKAALDKVLKARGFKYSLRVDHYSSITCTIQSGPVDFIGNYRSKNCPSGYDRDGYLQVNPYWIPDHFTGEAAEILSAAVDGLKAAGYYDKSDAMIDYFDTAYYFHLNVGQWNKPYTITPRTMRQAAAALTEKAIAAKIAAQGCSADFINNQLIIKVIA
jgi:hypothetical protein